MVLKLVPSPTEAMASKIPTPSAEKLAIWAHARRIWLLSGKPPHVTADLLDAEYEASVTD